MSKLDKSKLYYENLEEDFLTNHRFKYLKGMGYLIALVILVPAILTLAVIIAMNILSYIPR